MLSGKPGKHFAALMFLLCSFTVPLGAQTAAPTAPPAPSREVQEGMVAAMTENKEYAAVKARADSIRQKLEALQAKIVSQNPEVNKFLAERQKLQQNILEAARGGKSETEIASYRNRIREVTWQLEKIFAASPEYVSLTLKLSAALAEMNWTFQKVLATSTDPRVLKFIDAMEKTVGDYIAYSVRNLPKADVKGSDEFKAAVKGIEKFREDPVRYRMAMEQHGAPLRQKMEWRAGKEPAIRELNRKLSLTRTELYWKRALVEEKNPDLTWKVKTFSASPDSMTPDGIRKFDAMNAELIKAVQADPDCAKLDKKEQEFRKAHKKALDDFTAKSMSPEAVEFRKAKALVEEANKTSSAKKQ